MIDLQFTPLTERIDEVSNDTKRLIEFHSDAQKVIDFVRFTCEAPKLNGDLKGKVDIYDLFWKKITFTFSNIPVEEAIDKILGPLHRKFGYMWTLKLDGEADDPVFVFKSLKRTPIETHFSIKEGEFKTCEVQRKVLVEGRTETICREPIYEMSLKCF